MNHTTRKKKSKLKGWAHRRGWRNHGFACYDDEWDAIREVAGLSGAKSVNAWIRGWLLEAVGYERIQIKEKNERYESLDDDVRTFAD